MLLEEDELAFYRSRAFTLSSLRGRLVESNRSRVGELTDVVAAGDGRILAILVKRDGKTERVPFGASVRLAPASRTAA